MAIEAVVIFLLVCVLPGLGGEQDILRLPLVVLFGVIAFLGALTIAASVLNFFGLSNPFEALGLPQGSVRALIALSLILIFAIMVIFMANNLMQVSRQTFPVNSTVVYDGETYRSENGSVVIMVGPSKAAVDFTNQVLTTVSTLVVALAGFYFGNRSAQQNESWIGAETEEPAPSISISPDSPTTLNLTGKPDEDKLSITVTPKPEKEKVDFSVKNDENATITRSAKNANEFAYTPSDNVKKATTKTVVTLKFYLTEHKDVAKELEVTVEPKKA